MIVNGRAFVKRTSITFKIFIVTSLLLFVSVAIIYSTLYFYLPIFYETYKKGQIDTAVEQLIVDVRNLSVQEAKPRVEQFGQTVNTFPLLYDSNGQFAYRDLLFAGVSATVSSSITTVNSGSITVGTAGAQPKELPNVYAINTPVTFKDNVLTLSLNVTLQPINEASRVLLLLIPYICLLILLVSVSGAYMYSRIISRPLIAINCAAKKMARLDFKERIEHESLDEIGELSDSLNEMSTKLQHTMQDLQTANLQLKSDMENERKMEAKRRELVSIISHELKSPLTAVKGQLDGMIHEIGVYKDRHTYLRKSYKILENMEQLVHEMVHISKFQHQLFSPKKIHFKLSSLLGSIIQDLDYFAIEKNIRVITDIEAELFVQSDAELLEKALKNVIHNAIVYTPASEKVIIHLKKNEDGVLHFDVLNTGIHIPEDDLAHLFEPFYRIEKSRNRNTGGSGLGLYIVKMTLEALAIDFFMESTERGVLFSASIPPGK